MLKSPTYEGLRDCFPANFQIFTKYLLEHSWLATSEKSSPTLRDLSQFHKYLRKIHQILHTTRITFEFDSNIPDIADTQRIPSWCNTCSQFCSHLQPKAAVEVLIFFRFPFSFCFWLFRLLITHFIYIYHSSSCFL